MTLLMSASISDSGVSEIPGDLFDAPEGSALIHACNTQGAWGAGIAQVFRQKYPAAYHYYRTHCQTYRYGNTTHAIAKLQAGDESTVSVRLPLGTALVIPPQPGDYRGDRVRHWIICLFTSRNYGVRVDSPDMIVNSTRAALQDLKCQLNSLRNDHQNGGAPAPGDLYSCRFNSGLFAVPWKVTRGLVEDVGLDMTVVYPAEDTEGKNGKEGS